VREVTNIIKSKGKDLVADIENEIQHIKASKQPFPTINQEIRAEAKIEALKKVVKQVKETFELK
jgi:archaellum component FlaC